MDSPAVKGSIVSGAIEELNRLQQQDRLSADLIETRLETGDLVLLEEKPNPAKWYPMAFYARLLDLLGDVHAGDREEYFRERGRANAQRLMDAGLYQQLGFVDRWSEEIRAGSFRSDEAVPRYVSKLKLVVTLAGSIYSVGEWIAQQDPDSSLRALVVVNDASDYSDPMRFAAEGFLNQSSGRSIDLFKSERPHLSRILFRMTIDIPQLARP